MKFQVFHVNPGEKLMKKDDNNKLIRSFINFPTEDICMYLLPNYYSLTVINKIID